MSLKGKACKVSIGANQVLGIFDWSISGISVDMLEDTEFGDDYKTFVPGLIDGGEVSFHGWLKTSDTTGQDALVTALKAGTELDTLRCYTDATNYWTPMSSAPDSHITVSGIDMSSDKSGMVEITFKGKVSGMLELTSDA